MSKQLPSLSDAHKTVKAIKKRQLRKANYQRKPREASTASVDSIVQKLQHVLNGLICMISEDESKLDDDMMEIASGQSQKEVRQEPKMLYHNLIINESGVHKIHPTIGLIQIMVHNIRGVEPTELSCEMLHVLVIDDDGQDLFRGPAEVAVTIENLLSVTMLTWSQIMVSRFQ